MIQEKGKYVPQGKTYDDILLFYYRHAQIQKLYE